MRLDKATTLSMTDGSEKLKYLYANVYDDWDRNLVYLYILLL